MWIVNLYFFFSELHFSFFSAYFQLVFLFYWFIRIYQGYDTVLQNDFPAAFQFLKIFFHIVLLGNWFFLVYPYLCYSVLTPRLCLLTACLLVLTWFHKAWNNALTLVFFLFTIYLHNIILNIFPHWLETSLLFGCFAARTMNLSVYRAPPQTRWVPVSFWVSVSSSVSGVRGRHHSCSCYFAAWDALIHEFHRRSWVLCGARVCAKHWEYKRNWSEAVMSVSWRQIQQESFRLDGSQLHRKGGITVFGMLSEMVMTVVSEGGISLGLLSLLYPLL